MTEMNKLTFALYGTAVVDIELQWKGSNKHKRAGMTDEQAGMAVSVRSALLGTLIGKCRGGLFGWLHLDLFVEQRMKLLLPC